MVLSVNMIVNVSISSCVGWGGNCIDGTCYVVEQLFVWDYLEYNRI